MDTKTVCSLVVKDFIEEKTKELATKLGIDEKDLETALDKEIREVSLRIINKIENNFKLETFNKINFEKIYKESLNEVLKKVLDGISENLKKENLLITKFLELLDSGDIKAILYYMLIKRLQEKKESLSAKEVIIH
ncbi:MAG: hypothetical protein QXQ16_02910 [Candidatus Aenigmatarchaeota archaeon]